MSALQKLDWDSTFFRRKIGKYEINTDEDADMLPDQLSVAKDEAYDLVYIFSPKPLSYALASGVDMKMTDLKTLYQQDLSGACVSVRSPQVSPVQPSDPLTSLYELACESGQYSRYKLDEHFLESEFKNMYRLWVENSVMGLIANNVYQYKEETEAVGLITLKITNEKGIIGLLATAPAYRNRGIGSTLIDQVRNDLLEKGITKLEVTTQAANRGACQFYEKNGFGLASQILIYHVWL